ncbi:MAG: GNAT family N-acetyltransferase/peptidase C39 family protein [Candidatus Competibacterales bacterium]
MTSSPLTQRPVANLGFTLDVANLADLDALTALEQQAFSKDRLSRRSLRHMLTKAHADLQVARVPGTTALAGYVLVLYSKVTATARLYSIAVDESHRRGGVASGLLAAAEGLARERGCISLRLEIRRDNLPSQALFRRHGYRPFAVWPNYYQDRETALRFEKPLVQPQGHLKLLSVPHYRQTLEFTCGPAALMMAMKALDPALALDRKLELRLWREATTIYMTSGHGGCSPQGLALAARRRGFAVKVYLNGDGVFLVNSVRSPEKRAVMALVQEDMEEELAGLGVTVQRSCPSLAELKTRCEAGAVSLMLISSYRFYGERTPHWVVITGFDERYIYTHDPFVDSDEGETVTDSLNMPIPLRLFETMARYGKGGQRAVVILERPPDTPAEPATGDPVVP